MTDLEPSTHGGATASFPKNIEEFDADPRISFSRLDDKWILEEDNGSEWQYDMTLKRWVPMLDEDLVEQQRQAYAVAGVDDNEPAMDHKAKKSKKRKQRDDDDEGNAKKERVNTAVYVTSIPLDATADEVIDLFSKYGLIAENLSSGEKRVKLYSDKDGNFKGEALVVYFRPESVHLAIDMLDDSDFRYGVPGPQGKMRVQVADSSFKKHNDDHGERLVRRNQADKTKAVAAIKKLNKKLSEWSDDEYMEEEEEQSRRPSRWDRVVVLKHMFTLQEIEEHHDVITEIQEDIMEEASKFGEVQNVALYDEEVDGVATVKFSDVEGAKKCVKGMHGRAFDGRSVIAYIADGKEIFKKKRKETDLEEEDRRLEDFAKKLEAGHMVKDSHAPDEKNGNERGQTDESTKAEDGRSNSEIKP